MTILRGDMPTIDHAIFSESWRWLEDNVPELADALATEVTRGAKPKDIRRHVMALTQRDKLAARVEQAAEYLISQNGHS